MKIKPTARDVRVAFHSIGHNIDRTMFNDLRVDGGRIKIFGACYMAGDMHNVEVLLNRMHPSYKIEVYPHMQLGITSTCIAFKRRVRRSAFISL